MPQLAKDQVLTAPALGLLELESIARGVVVVDVLVKRAQVQINLAQPTSPGKFVIVFTGAVGDVEEAFAAGVEAAGALVIDKVLLPQLSLSVKSALEGKPEARLPLDSVGIVETHSVASAILAADTGLKRASVRLTHLHLARGIGGKAWFVVCGPQADVEASLSQAAASIEPALLLATEIIARPHRDWTLLR